MSFFRKVGGASNRSRELIDDPDEIGPLVEQIVAQARPNADMFGNDETD